MDNMNQIYLAMDYYKEDINNNMLTEEQALLLWIEEYSERYRNILDDITNTSIIKDILYK